jgi:hypothetical protein
MLAYPWFAGVAKKLWEDLNRSPMAALDLQMCSGQSRIDCGVAAKKIRTDEFGQRDSGSRR